MKKLLFLKGLPASGKSTYARELVRKGNWKRLNKDDLRAMLDDSKWSKANEQLVNLYQEQLTKDILHKGINVVVDNTHLAPKHEARYRQIAKECGAEFNIKFFDEPVEECIKRDLARANSVGEAVIRQMYNQFLKPAPAVYSPGVELPFAVMVDIDGTLAHITDRGPFDWAKVGSDKLDGAVAYLTTLIQGNDVKIILLSGRDGVCMPETVEWLKTNHVPYDELFMRPEGDMRKDSIVKRELFEAHVRNKYNVLFVLDDRDQVVEMWRNEIGLKVLQVAEGNF